MAEWAIDSEAMRTRGITVLVKSNKLVKKISRRNIFRKLKLDINPFLPPKHYKYGGRFSPLAGYTSSNQWLGSAGARLLRDARHKRHRSLHGSMCRMVSNATKARSTLRRVAEQLLILANDLGQ